MKFAMNCIRVKKIFEHTLRLHFGKEALGTFRMFAHLCFGCWTEVTLMLGLFLPFYFSEFSEILGTLLENKVH